MATQSTWGTDQFHQRSSPTWRLWLLKTSRRILARLFMTFTKVHMAFSKIFPRETTRREPSTDLPQRSFLKGRLPLPVRASPLTCMKFWASAPGTRESKLIEAIPANYNTFKCLEEALIENTY